MHYYNTTVSALFSRVSGEVCDQPAVCCLHRRRLSSQEVRQFSGLVSVTLRTVGQHRDIHLILISNMNFGLQQLGKQKNQDKLLDSFIFPPHTDNRQVHRPLCSPSDDRIYITWAQAHQLDYLTCWFEKKKLL